MLSPRRERPARREVLPRCDVHARRILGQAFRARHLFRVTRMHMCTCARLVCALTLLATPAAAQSTTDDGIRAVLRGDYQAAARILRPLAGDTARPDGVAQFFLAILYHSGQGVRLDELRACGLFVAAATREHPFSEQAAAIAALMRIELGGGASLCVADGWQGGPPQSFVLGPGHRVVFAETSVTVTHGEQEQRTVHIVPPGAVLLPIRHTPLVVTRPIGARRDFFQWFLWTPDRKVNPSSWTLAWTLCEVAGDGWVGFAGETNLLVVNGPTPPSPFDVSNLVRLSVNTNGEVEFTIAGGASPRTEVITWQGKQ
jgi:hypothetical protein